MAYLSEFMNKDLEDSFNEILIKQLNNITFNGTREIIKVTDYAGSICVRVSAYKTLPEESYSLRLNKLSKASLD